MKTQLHIMFVGLPSLFNIGGVQKSLTFLTEFLIAKGHRITLHSWIPDNGILPELSEITYNLDSSIKFIFTARDIPNMHELFDFISNDRPDVICVINSTKKGAQLLASCIRYNIPLVYSIRGSSQYCLKYLYPNRKFFEFAFYMADCAHVLMPSYREFFPPELKERIKVIPSPIQQANFFANTIKNVDGKFYILYSGRFSFEKQVHYLISAFSKISYKYPNWNLKLVGNGVLQDSYIEQLGKLNLLDRCEILNFDNSDALYTEVYPFCHIKVLPSEQEGCPMALREAMAHKIPVIAYKQCSGANEIIENYKSGILADMDDPINSLANALEYLINNSDERLKIAENAYISSKVYDVDFINNEWEKLLLDATNKTGYADKKIKNKYWKINYIKSLEIQSFISNFLNFDFPDRLFYDTPDYLFQKHKSDLLLLMFHDLFDKKFYSEKYFEVKESRMNPYIHYLEYGWKKGYNPSLIFDTNKYINIWMNGNAVMCPLVHFYRIGRFKGYLPFKVDGKDYTNRKYLFANYKFYDDIIREYNFIKNIIGENNK